MDRRFVMQCGACGAHLYRNCCSGYDPYDRCPACSKFLNTGSRSLSLVRTEQYVSTSVWYNPGTWFSGKWVPIVN